jgi:hypothetical protein
LKKFKKKRSLFTPRSSYIKYAANHAQRGVHERFPRDSVQVERRRDSEQVARWCVVFNFQSLNARRTREETIKTPFLITD